MADILDFRVKNGLAVTNTATIESTLNASSTNTGALIVSGGVGIGKNLVVGGNLTATNVYASGNVQITSTTGATTTTDGALTVSGGVGIAENLYVGGNVEIGSTTPSNSADSGALVVKGGLGVGGDFYVGGTLYAEITGVASTATNIEGGTAGQVPYQSAPGVTSFYGPGTAGQFLKSNGTSAPSYVDTSTIFVGYAVTATELSGGVAGSLPYQQGVGDTTFLGIGGAESVLTSSGTAPQWTSTGTLQVSRATTATSANTIETIVRTTNASHYLTFVDSNNATVGSEALYTTSTILYNPSTRRLAVGGTTAPTATLDVQGSMFVSGVTTVTNTTNASSTATGAFQVRGGAAVGLNLVVGSTATILSQVFSTSTVAGNALYVAGGVGIGRGLFVTGPSLFLDSVTFSGTSTSVFSTNTVYTDNFIDIHFPAGGSNGGVWNVDDGKNIGHIYHHYKDTTGDEHGALIWHNASDELRWYMGGVDYVGGAEIWSFDTGTYGVFRTGSIVLEHTTASSSTSTGALVVAGGVGIGKDLYVGGTIYGVAEVTGSITTASNINAGTTNQIPYQVAPGDTDFFGPGTAGQILVSNGTTAGGPVFTNTASIYVNDSEIATNVRGGVKGSVPYQSAPNTTSFVSTGTTGQFLQAQTNDGPIWTSTGSMYVGYAENADKVDTVIATGNSSHYLTFVDSNNASASPELIYTTSTLIVNPATGNVGVGGTPNAKLDVVGGVFISGITTVTNTTNATTTATGAFQVRGGAAVGLDLRVGGLATIGSTLAVTGNTTLTRDLAVNGGDLTSTAATFNLLNTAATSAINIGGWGTAVNISSSTGYTAIRNLTTITNTTNATSTTSGALRVVGGVGIQGNVYVGGTIYGNVDGTITNANTATNLAGGTAGQVPYQSAAGVTSFYGPGSAGQLLTSNGTSAPSYVNTTSVAVGRATTSTNIAAGAAGSLPYQSGAGATTFVSIGTNGYLLTSNGTAPVWTDPGTIAIGSAAKVVTTATSTNASFYLTFVDSNNAVSDNEFVYTDAGITYNPSTNDFTVSNNATVGGDLAVNGGDITSSQTTFNLLNSGVTTGNLFGAGTAVTIGATTGYTQIRNQTTITNTTAASSTNTGALQVRGGVGIAGDSYHGGVGYFINNTNATTTATGALQVRGGAAVGLDIVVGGKITGLQKTGEVLSVGDSTVGTDKYISIKSLFGNLEIGRNTNTNAYINSNMAVGTLDIIHNATKIQINTADGVVIPQTTASSNTQTGALVVAGGVGIGKDLYVGGTIYGAVSGTSESATTATNLAAGTAGQVPYQASPGLTSFFGPGSAGQLLVSQGVNAPQYTNTGTIAVGRATSSTHLIAGAAGSLPYQSAVNLTTFLGIGAAGTLLQSTGSAPQWVTTASIFAANANNAENIKTLARPNQAVHYLTFVDSNNSTAAYEALYTSATIVFDPGTKYLGIGTASPTSNLEVSGAVKISGIFTSTNTTAATSTITGAMQVAGGIGIGGNIYSGGNGVFAGDLAVNGGDITSSQTTFNFVDSTVTTLNIAREGTAITIGSNSAGSTTIRNITNITTSTTATTSTNGALVVSGGVGVAADIWAAGDVRARNILPPFDGVGVVGSAAATWADGNFTNLTIDGTLSVRTAIDLADSDVLRFGSSDDAYFVYNGTPNTFELQLEAAATSFIITDNGTTRHTFHKNGGVEFVGVTTVTNTTAATASTSGALVVAGGVGVGGDLYVAGTIYGTVSVSGSISTATNLAGGTAGQVPYQSAPGITAFYGPGTAGQLLVSGGAAAPVYTNTASIYVNDSQIATNVRNGSAGSIVYQSAANTSAHLSLSATTGSVLVAGASAPEYQTNVKAITGTASNTTSTGQSLQVTAGGIGVLGNSYFGDSLSVRTNLKVEGSTNATNQTTGALQVVGGIGVGGDIYAAGGDFGNIRVGITGDNEIDTSSGNLTIDSAGGTVTVDDNLTVVGNLTVQGTTTYVDSTVTNVADPIITIGGGANGAAPAADDNKDRGIAFQWHNGTNARTGFFGFDDSTGFFTFISSATFTNEVVAPAGGTTRGAIDANLAGGTAMSLPYQSAPNTTAFLAAGTSGFVLQTNGTGSAPTWVNASTLGAGSATTLNTLAQTASANYFLTFVDSNNATAAAESFYTSSTIYYNPATANLVIGGDLTVSGGQITMDTTSTRDKYRVYNDSTYTIGFQSGVSFGAIGSDWAMTFQNSNNNTRGFWWGDSAHTAAQGAMALSTDGKLTVAHSVRLGYGETDTTVPGATYRLDVSGDTYISGNVGIGIAPTYKLHVNGSFAATTKSFVIDHPTKPGMKLRYGSLEGPENGVYVRGRLTGNNVIELPEYWTKLVDPDSITVTLTAIGEHQKLYVKDIKDNTVIVGGGKAIDCFYTVWAERKDVEKLAVEINAA